MSSRKGFPRAPAYVGVSAWVGMGVRGERVVYFLIALIGQLSDFVAKSVLSKKRVARLSIFFEV